HDGAALSQTKRDLENLHHCKVYPTEDDAVDRQAEIECTKAAQERCGLAGVTQLSKLDVSHHARASPQSCIQKNGEHSAHHKVPPKPVARDSVSRDETCDC